MRVDDVQFMEWCEASLLPDGFFAVEAVRTTGGSMTVTLERRSN